MFSRDDFEKSCKAFLSKYVCSDDVVFGGWSWNEHKYLPRLGYLARERTIRSCVKIYDDSKEVESIAEESQEDAATAPTCPDGESLDVCEYIVYSATFQVPAFYFSVHTRSGSPLPLDRIVASSLFRRDAFGNARKTSFALQTPGQAFPLLSQGEHPTLGTPCWLFHPCETPAAMAELMQADGGVDAASARVLELWLLLVGNIISLRR